MIFNYLFCAFQRQNFYTACEKNPDRRDSILSLACLWLNSSKEYTSNSYRGMMSPPPVAVVSKWASDKRVRMPDTYTGELSQVLGLFNLLDENKTQR